MVENMTITVIRANTGAVTVDGDGTDISGSATQVIAAQYDSVDILGTTLEWLLK